MTTSAQPSPAAGSGDRMTDGLTDGLPSVLHLMAQDLTSRHFAKQLTADLNQALEQASSQYSFVREQALLHICDTLGRAASARRPAGLPQLLLDTRYKQVAALLLDTVARFQEQPEARLGRPSVTSLVDGELEAAVKAIQGMALTHKRSWLLFAGGDVMAQLLALLPRTAPACVGSILDALLTLQINSPTAQARFVEGMGFQQLAQVAASEGLPEAARQRCLDTLALLLQCVHSQPPARASLRQVERVLSQDACTRLLDPQAVQISHGQDSTTISALLEQQ
eukprot:jgi/Tetstr1/463390/TSEL_008312.t1